MCLPCLRYLGLNMGSCESCGDMDLGHVCDEGAVAYYFWNRAGVGEGSHEHFGRRNTRRTECLVHAVERVHVDEGVLRKLDSESEQPGSTTDQSWYVHTLMQSEYLRIGKRISW